MSKELILAKYPKQKMRGSVKVPENHPAKRCGHCYLPVIIPAISISDAKKAMDEWGIEIFKFLIADGTEFTFNLKSPEEMYSDFKTEIEKQK